MLKVGIHCDGCAKKVTKVLNKIEGKKESFFKRKLFEFFVYFKFHCQVSLFSALLFLPKRLRDVLD